MFGKAKVKRFNEEFSCAPPPTKYDPKVSDKCGGCYLNRSKRWIEKNKNEITSDFGTYLGSATAKDFTSTPFKKGKSASQMNTSVSSSTSASSQSGFLSPPQTFSRTRSFKSSKSKDALCEELQEKIKILSKEKSDMQNSLAELEKELSALKFKCESSKTLNTGKCVSDLGVQVDRNDFCAEAQQPQDITNAEEPQDLSCPKKESSADISSEEVQLLRDKIEHLTVLRDNLEACVEDKEDTITDLQMQIDLIVVDSQKSIDTLEVYKQEAEKVKRRLEETVEEIEMKNTHVKDLVANYETLMRYHEDACLSTKEIIAQKDIEIELLNDSIATLDTQVSEYEKTISRIQSEVTLQRSQISNLEITVGDLSIASKEKEFVETILEDEIQEKNKEVSILEFTLKDVESKLKDLGDDREGLLQKLKEEKSNVKKLQKKTETLEVTLKEREVIQQFLEKELANREEEVNELNAKLTDQERDLETARKVALDLQHEAEVQLNELFCLQASLKSKDYDLESKEDLITSLKEEMNQNGSVSLEVKERINPKQNTHAELMEGNHLKEERINSLEENIINLKSALDKEEDHSNNLEGRVMQLMIENGQMEKEFKRRLLDKESEIEELSVKYSDALLEQESTKRILSLTSEKLERENLLLQATEKELEDLRGELVHSKGTYAELETSSKELTHKLIHIEDALACEEAESRDLQRKLEAVEEHLSDTESENQALQSINEGYTGQISMLKIDMTKKSLAVEDMQIRIEELREEKNALIEERKFLDEEKTLLQVTLKLLESKLLEKETMLKDLQDEFEGRLLTITSLQEELNNMNFGMNELKKLLAEKNRDEEQRVNDFEEEKSEFFNQISLLENHLKEEQEQRSIYKVKAMEMKDKANVIEEEKRRAIMSLQSQLKSEKSQVENLEERLINLNRKYEGYEDQLINMQTSLVDKTAEAEKWNQTYIEVSQYSVSYSEKIEELKKDISKLVKESELLSNSLTSKDTLLSSLNDSISVKSEEIQSLHKNLMEKQEQLGSLERRLQAMEKTVTLLQDERAMATSKALSLQESFDVTKGELMRINCTLEREHESRVADMISEHNNKVEELTRAREALQKESDTWRQKFEYLEKMIEPFREQLDAYEVEKFALLSKSNEAENEMKRLSDEYAHLLGHNNHKQKIQHVVKLKTENNQLRERVLKLQTELEKQKKIVRRLEEKGEPPLRGLIRSKSTVTSSKSVLVERENKENASPEKEDMEPHLTSTPLTTSKLNRYRRL